MVALLLILLMMVNVFSIAGFAIFGLHPALLAKLPGAYEIYGAAFPYASRAQIALSFLTLAFALSRDVGRAWVSWCVAIASISACMELSGTGVGVPFGKYAYTDLLGWKILGRVPILIPLSWFAMAVPSYAIVAHGRGAARRPIVRVILSAALLLMWDLALDPAMSYLTRYWEWERTGIFYGMPMTNLFGWFVTGLFIMAALELFQAQAKLAHLSARFCVAFYTANIILPLGMVIAAKLWLATFVTLVMAAFFGLLLRGGSRAPSPSSTMHATL